MFRRERDKLEKSLGGIRNMTKTPSALWVVDTNKEHLAITEAKKLGIPVIAILDTNCDPDDVTIGIPGNDDAIRSIELLTKVIADAAADGLIARHSSNEAEAEPLAEWERELLEQGSAAPAADTVIVEPSVDAPVETPVEAPVKAKVKAPVEGPAKTKVKALVKEPAPVAEEPAPVAEKPAPVVEEPAAEVAAEEVKTEEKGA